MSILAINAGSSSLKFGLYDNEAHDRIAEGEIDWADGNRNEATLNVQWRNGEATRVCVAVADDSVAAQPAIKALLDSAVLSSHRVSGQARIAGADLGDSYPGGTDGGV